MFIYYKGYTIVYSTKYNEYAGYQTLSGYGLTRTTNFYSTLEELKSVINNTQENRA